MRVYDMATATYVAVAVNLVVGGFVLRAATPAHVGVTHICNCRFELV